MQWVLRCVRLFPRLVFGGFLLAGAVAFAQAPTPPARTCTTTVNASVVALDQVISINRLGTIRPDGMIYALLSDVVSTSNSTSLTPGKVQLRTGKRPRPLVLRVHEGDCLRIAFTNLLNPTPLNGLQPTTRNASIHVAGLQPVNSITDDGTYVGANPSVPSPASSQCPAASENYSGVAPPGCTAVYTLYAAARGTYLMYSTPGDFNGFNTEQLTMGLFGAVNVEPPGTEWYRSQVPHADFLLASRWIPESAGGPGHYEVNYNATYGTAPGAKPILKILDSGNNIVYGDLTAVITGPRHGLLPAEDFANIPENPALPGRLEPYREITVHYHESQDLVQAFPWAYNPGNGEIADVNAGLDGFAINYGVAGITSEILANRFGLGPARDCVDCKFEEFFLNSWAGGDPAMIVDQPANLPCQTSQMLALALAPSATAPCTPGSPPTRATLAHYPDDPSNVYHSYLGDHVQFQILHAGAAVHHVHHHHAHQWLHSPNSPDTSYLDSQAIGPGSSFTLDLVYHGSGNLNLTAGDSIFHCHFYPHFAAGMWALFRVHDVFEEGTQLDSNGRPAPGSRALPDGEILAGTPIPALVPLPARAMAPMPEKVEIVNGQVHVLGQGHPGYPFFVPGTAGHRPPHPPLDFAQENGQELNGGLPRHVVLNGIVVNEQHTTTDFSKDVGPMKAVQLPEAGTPQEIAAMRYFGQRKHASFTPTGARADFVVNGLPRKSAANPTGAQSGAPFADPGVDENGNAVGDLINGKPRLYKGANLQVDAVLNKKGWHFPQQRMIALWDDVNEIRAGNVAPQPFFFRANAGDLVEFWHANLIPSYYELDDFQVRTPTDILGQHIHLVKFDVLASDGAANGFNYEDGSFSPDEVRSRISGINAAGGLCVSFDCSSRKILQAKAIPGLGPGPKGGPKNMWLGAQATVQRWYVDSRYNSQNNDDRTYLTIFTHDHFGPSTHQEAGLYGGLLVEPKCSAWTSPDGRQRYGSRGDGGPTSYAANIIPAPNPAADCKRVESYREFALAWGDLQLVYQPTSKSKPDCYPGQTPDSADCKPLAPDATYTGWSDPANAINCPACTLPGSIPAIPGGSTLPYVPQNGNFGNAASPPSPRLVSDFGNGVFSMNYRAEPLPLRVTYPPPGSRVDPAATQVSLDLSHAFRSIPRYDAAMSMQPKPHSSLNPACSGPGCLTFPVTCQVPAPAVNGCGMLPADPYTPLLRAYENDNVQIRVLAGAHTSMHDFTLHGLKWFFEPFNKNSGYRDSQLVLLSEHYEMLFKMPPLAANVHAADYLYNPSASYEGLVNGSWGILRSYKGEAENLARLPGNPARPSATTTRGVELPSGIPNCAGTPLNQPVSEPPCLREFNISAASAREAFGDAAHSLVYNSRGALTGADANKNPIFGGNPLYDPEGLVYVLDDGHGHLLPPPNPEPLVLRANAGDWIRVKLSNHFRSTDPPFSGGTPAAKAGGTAPYTNPYNSVMIHTSPSIGLHAQLVAFDVTRSNGVNVGVNPVQTVSPGDPHCPGSDFPCREYLWYAGSLESNTDGSIKTVPVEFGAINLTPSDPLMHVFHGLFGSLVIEPEGSKWRSDTDYRASATVFPKNAAPFREFVLMAQDDINMFVNGNSFYASSNNLSAFNYRSEPFFYRFGYFMNTALGGSAPPNWGLLTSTDLASIGGFQFTAMDTTQGTSNTLVSGDPQTPIFRAPGGMPVRFRLLDPGGIGDNQQVFELTGHVWEEEPYTSNSSVIGHNPLSQHSGTTAAYGPTSHYNILVDRAGGVNAIPGDYLYRSWTANQYQVGMWGLFRVGPTACSANGCPDTVTIGSVKSAPSGGFIATGVLTVSPRTNSFASSVTFSYGGQSGQATVGNNGAWTFQGAGGLPETLTVTSANGGVAVYHSYLNRPAAPPASTVKPLIQRRKFTRN